MIIDPNTTNQVRVQDVDGDEVWFDAMTDADLAVIVTTKDDGYNHSACALSLDDLDVVIAHLTSARDTIRRQQADATYRAIIASAEKKLAAQA